MTTYRDGFVRITHLIRALLEHPQTQKYNDRWSQASADVLRDFFGSSNEAKIIDALDDCADNAPFTFQNLWENVANSLHQYESDPQRALRLLSRLIGWSFIERSWSQ